MTASRTEARHDLIVVGASAGGVEALRTFLHRLPTDLAASVLVVVHLPAGGAGVLPLILARESALPVGFCGRNEPLRHGRVLIAPPTITWRYGAATPPSTTGRRRTDIGRRWTCCFAALPGRQPAG